MQISNHILRKKKLSCKTFTVLYQSKKFIPFWPKISKNMAITFHDFFLFLFPEPDTYYNVFFFSRFILSLKGHTVSLWRNLKISQGCSIQELSSADSKLFLSEFDRSQHTGESFHDQRTFPPTFSASETWFPSTSCS